MYRRNEWLMVMMVLASVLMAGWFYPQLPDVVASHWNAEGQVDGYMDKGMATFMLPVMMLLLAALFFVIPRIDPLKENIEKFRDAYEEMVIVILAFFLFIYLQTMLWNIGIRISVALTVPFGVGLLFIYLGFLLQKAKRNWFVGIRTPWTMSSDRVWEKTHKIGGTLFKAMGIVVILSIFLGSASFYVMIAGMLVVVAYLFWYSYVEYEKEKNK
ncbi:MAG: SdpI family protein [Candidatus Micrarchaeota archaeon]|nr:SdpI family protein [Candidatus Micrarchaeota archaeon]